MSHSEVSWIHQAATWIENNWADVAYGVNPILCGLLGSLTSDEVSRMLVGDNYKKIIQGLSMVVLVVLIAGQVALIVARRKHADKVSELRKEYASLKGKRDAGVREVTNLIFAFLKQLGEHDLAFGEKRGEAERLTLYLHDGQRSAFVPVTRFSNSPEFCRIARREYPDSEGCLALVWRKGYAVSSGYPDPTYWETYVQRAAKDGISAETVARIRMKSRLYCGTAIWNRDRTRQVGALMLESTSDRYSTSDMHVFMKKHEQGFLGELIDALN